jgi:hypothetical protein
MLSGNSSGSLSGWLSGGCGEIKTALNFRTELLPFVIEDDAETRRHGDTERLMCLLLPRPSGERFLRFEAPHFIKDSVARIQSGSQSLSEFCLRVPHSPCRRVLEYQPAIKVKRKAGNVSISSPVPQVYGWATAKGQSALGRTS